MDCDDQCNTSATDKQHGSELIVGVNCSYRAEEFLTVGRDGVTLVPLGLVQRRSQRGDAIADNI